VTLLRGTREGLEVVLAGRDLEEALAELEARLAEQPTFYEGSSATADFGASLPTAEELERLGVLLAGAGIELRALRGSVELEAAALAAGLAFEPSFAGEASARGRRGRSHSEVTLSEAARSLVADFAGARSDIAQRRKRGEASVPRLRFESQQAETPQPALHLVETPPSMLYHTGTLRGGQALHHGGNIVIVGDVNPGAELVATGDIIVFGRLAGIAHAGAQGDAAARIYAIDLAATQLRIATLIAADDAKPRRVPTPEAAIVRDGRIVILSLDQLGDVDNAGASVG
jgi:septum site-determining protein MinC